MATLDHRPFSIVRPRHVAKLSLFPDTTRAVGYPVTESCEVPHRPVAVRVAPPWRVKRGLVRIRTILSVNIGSVLLPRIHG